VVALFQRTDEGRRRTDKAAGLSPTHLTRFRREPL
jgi:hypothetical protein